MRIRAVRDPLLIQPGAIRAMADHASAMSNKREQAEAVVSYLRQGPERSTLFWWLVEHHDELAEAKGRKQTRWEPLAAQLASYGLTDRNNKAASPAVLRLTWKRVRRYVTDDRTAKEAAEREKKRQPSRLPATWRPQEATPPQASRPFAPSPPNEASAIVNNEDCTPEEALAGLRRILAERSGR